jgi:hypothetical protein
MNPKRPTGPSGSQRISKFLQPDRSDRCHHFRAAVVGGAATAFKANQAGWKSL